MYDIVVIKKAKILDIPGKNILQGFQDYCKKRDIFSTRSLQNFACFLKNVYIARFLHEKGHFQCKFLAALQDFCTFLARTVQEYCTVNLARYFFL